MNTNFTHPPERVIQQLLVDLSLGTLPSSSSSWPVYINMMPDTTENCIGVIETTGIIKGRAMPNGNITEDQGIQLLIRNARFEAVGLKARAIAESLSANVLRTSVTISSSVYNVQGFNRVSGPISLGLERQGNKAKPVSKRYLFSINGLAPISQTT